MNKNKNKGSFVTIRRQISKKVKKEYIDSVLQVFAAPECKMKKMKDTRGKQ